MSLCLSVLARALIFGITLQAETTTFPYLAQHKVQPEDLEEFEVPSRCSKSKVSSLGDALLVSKFISILLSQTVGDLMYFQIS